MKTLFTVLIVIVILGIAYYFVSKPAAPYVQTNTYSTVPSAPAPTTTDTMTMPTTVQSVTTKTSVTTTPAHSAITIQNFAFNPASMTVKAGTTVTWTNADSASHTVTSDSGSTMNSSLLATGQSYSVTFSTPGTFAYHCSVHPMMHGTVIVTN